MNGYHAYQERNRMRGVEVCACVHCRTEFFVERPYHEMGCCDECARKLGALWIKFHVGTADRHLDPVGYAKQKAKKSSKYKKKVIPQSLRWAVFERDKFRCVACDTHLNLRADHIVPEIKGGPMVMENLQTLCAACNSFKGGRNAQ